MVTSDRYTVLDSVPKMYVIMVRRVVGWETPSIIIEVKYLAI